MNYILPEIPYLRLRFGLTSLDNAELRPMKGSMLRGVFGHALKGTVCVMGKEAECEHCMLREQCVYTRIFKTFIEGKSPPFLQGLKSSPRPFIIDAPETKRNYKKGEKLQFYFTLFGKAIELHPYVIFSFGRACERGLTPKRYPFQLSRVDWYNGKWNKLYDGEKQCLCSMAKPSSVIENSTFKSPLTLKFMTPTRLKFNNELTMDFTFRMLILKMLRRTLEIAHFYAPDTKPDWEFHDLLVKADEVRFVDKKLYWEDWTRYSNRQNSTLKIGGFFGDVTLDGDISPFSHLLRIAEVLHVGKGTVFGLGKMKIQL